ncbi:MAG: uroporphyrinogen-III C-methyltransferase [Gammaproteobacteria bacterium]|nr:uroporphyrinogen-III C-methyltransferase [Gammaproteobacteria bacterium]
MTDKKDLEAEPTPEAPETPDTSDTPEPSDAVATPAKSGRVWPLIILILIILLAAAAGGAGWVFDQRLKEQAAVQQNLVSDVQQQLGEMAGRVTVLNQALESRLEGVARLENRVNDLRDAISRRAEEAEETNWQEAEAAWLARLAIHRLRFNADYEGSLEALKAADALLAELGGAGIDGRAAIAEAVDRLLQADRPETPLITQGLTALSERLDELPLAQDVASAAGSAEPLTDTAPAPTGVWERVQRAWDRLVAGLEGLVVVSRERTVVPLPDPEERFLLQQNLQLKAESARLAALMGDAQSYDAALEQIDGWVDAYFDTVAPEVVDVRERIAELRERVVVAEQPDIQAPLQRLVNAIGEE